MLLGEAALPWTRLKHGLFVDGVVTAVQRFDSSSWENENGVFAVLGADVGVQEGRRRRRGVGRCGQSSLPKVLKK